MRIISSAIVALLLAASVVLAQQDPNDPGLPDSVIVDSLVYQPWEEQPNLDSIYIIIWIVTDDSVDSYSIPLEFTYEGDGIISPEPGVQCFPPVSFWEDRFDSLQISERRLLLSGQVNLDSTPNWVLLTNDQRVSCWKFKLHILPGSSPPMSVHFDSTYDSQIGSLHFGIRGYGNIDSFVPAFRRGVFSLESWWPSSINDDKTGEMPEKFALAQNYPNPFNAQTTISYNLPQSGPVTLSIYNIMGQKVATLFDGEQQAGEHKVVWDAGDVTSGVYFGRLEAGTKAQSMRMILLK
jgi:hypothetical protein